MRKRCGLLCLSNEYRSRWNNELYEMFSEAEYSGYVGLVCGANEYMSTPVHLNMNEANIKAKKAGSKARGNQIKLCISSKFYHLDL